MPYKVIMREHRTDGNTTSFFIRFTIGKLPIEQAKCIYHVSPISIPTTQRGLKLFLRSF